MALEHLVALPPGPVRVRLDRSELNLAERGGFEACWAGEETNDLEVLEVDAYRSLVKAHLAEVYRLREGQDPPGITLNLASHQLIDDLVGWSKLNAQNR
ncbi:MAG: hypothetical protein JSV66_10285 [Trueperaceae bacterium]|nr:MAG: hypothetical protein JSV66_10285 [Trueperaceae bacterium]